MTTLLDGLAEFLNQSVTVERYTGRDAYGKPTYAAPTTLKARVQGRARRIVTQSGEDVTSTLQVYFGTTETPPTVRDRITLPSPFAPTQPTILAVSISPDEEGALVCALYC